MAERRYATSDEQDTLAKYVGWGDSQVARFLAETAPFNFSASEKGIWQELRDLTTEPERAALRASSPNAHFTYHLYQPIWAALERAGFAGGHVLEPAVGTGHAFGFMPAHLRANSTLLASELDPMTAAIAQALYPSARVQAIGYENAAVPRGTQDLIISNVPFGDFGVSDDRMPRYLTRRIHNYFFARALEHVRPGGHIVFLTSHYTLDAQTHIDVRRYLMTKGHFVGAVRLPSTAFDKTAKTEVVTDIIVLQRLKEGETARNAEAFINSEPQEHLAQSTIKRGKRIVTETPRSTWYDTHKNLILGTEDMTGTMYGGGQVQRHRRQRHHPDGRN